ncbi:ribonuclease P/MRP protein subunit RPP20 [Acrasis kona]|uniref:Ribonuclease P/MRP protein subunit RPP20 n=1 Tax=Acrasis kona TaxID=1008807 RepID=A0AAW2YWP9_9EUKA
MMDAKRRKVDVSDDESEESEDEVYFVQESTIIKPFPCPDTYAMRKRTPSNKKKAKANEIYISRKSKLTAVYARAKKIFNHELYDGICIIHALGSAILIAIDLSLQLQRDFNLTLHTRTDTVKLVDDFIPKDGVGEVLTQVRYNSAVHITLQLKSTKELFKKIHGKEERRMVHTSTSIGNIGDDFISI